MVEADSSLKLLLTSFLDICKVFEHIYAVIMCTVTALHSYTHHTWLRFGGSVSLFESSFGGLMTRGVSLMAMLSADTTATEYTWK